MLSIIPFDHGQRESTDRPFKTYTRPPASASSSSLYRPFQTPSLVGHLGLQGNSMDIRPPPHMHNAANNLMDISQHAQMRASGYGAKHDMTSNFCGFLPAMTYSNGDLRSSASMTAQSDNFIPSSPSVGSNDDIPDDDKLKIDDNEELKVPPKKRPHCVPEDMKDSTYWEKRKKNNESAKRSRDARRMKEEQIAMRVVYLEQENLQLRTEVSLLKSEIEKLRCMLYNS